MSQLQEMSVFVKIIDAGSISKAADQLGIAKSAVSRRLNELEQRLGVQLLSRTTRTSSLTEAGRSYYHKAVQILDEVLELDANISSKTTSLQGKLNIAVPFSFGVLHLSSAIDDFAKLHPELTININLSDRRVDMIEEGIDLAIRIADMKDSSLIARKLAPVRFMLCASPDYLKTTGIPVCPPDLKDHIGLHYAYISGGPWKITDPAGKIHRVKVPTKMRANNGEFLQDMAIAGHGVARLPTFIAADSIRSGKLVQLLPDYQLPHMNAYLVYPQTRHLLKRVRTLIDFLIERFAGEPYWDR